MNPNCDYGMDCTGMETEVRKIPVAGGGNVILCKSCFERTKRDYPGIQWDTLKLSDSQPTWKDIISNSFNLTTDRLFRRHSDLYIGCNNWEEANKIKNAGPWRAMASIFTPNKGSDMQQFPFGVDIPLACLGEEIEARKAGV